MRAFLPFSALLAAGAGHAAPPGTEYAPAVSVDVTPEGFDAITDIAPGLIPDEPLQIPDVYQYSVKYDDWGWIEVYEYELQVSDMWAELQINDLAITPGSGVLDVSADASVWLNEAADPFWVSAWAEGLGFLEIGDSCDGWLEPFGIQITTSIAAEIIEVKGTRTLDLTVAPIVWSTDLSGADVNLDNCTVGEIIDLLSFLGIDMLDLIFPLLEPTLDEELETVRAELETAVEDSFAELSIETEIDLLGAPLALGVAPSAVTIDPNGMRLDLAGYADIARAACIDEDPNGSTDTPGIFPSIGESPSTIPWPPHAGLIIEDDFVNNLLYGVYYGGTLCMTLDENSDEVPLELNTSLMGILHPDAFDGLWRESAPLVIDIYPDGPPVASPGGAYDISLDLEGLHLDFNAELDGRMSRIVGTSLDLNTGLNADFDAKTGVLGLDVAISGDDLTTSITHNEFAPGQDASIADGISGLFDTVASTLLGSLLSDATSFAIPSFAGIGLADMQLAPSGSAGDKFGAYVLIGNVDYGDGKGAIGCDDKGGCTIEGGGCDDKGGCDPESGCDTKGKGCDGGCAGTSIPSRSILLVLPLLVAALRRRA